MRFRKTLFAAIVFAIPVVFLELSLQLFYRVNSGDYLFRRMAIPIYSVDEHRYYKIRPDLEYRHRTNEYDVVYYSNSQGFRTNALRRDVLSEKGEDMYRILFLGPSFTFGWANNYEDSYVSIIGSSLDAPGRIVEVLNLGTPAQPIGYQLCWLEEMGRTFSPDMIVQTIYGVADGFDTECTELTDPPQVKNGYLYRSEPAIGARLFAAAKNSAIVFYGWNIYQSLLPQPDETIGLGLELHGNTANTDEVSNRGKAQSYERYIQFVEDSVHPDIPIVFLYVPVSYAVRPTDVSRWNHKTVEDPLTHRQEAKDIESLLTDRGITFVNPTDELVKRDKESRMYYWLDIHFTPEGNRALADKAIPVIQELIPH